MITYQLLDLEGNVENEYNLKLNDGDTLIMKYDSDKFKVEHVSKLFDKLKISLENNEGLIPLPKGIDLQILSKNKEEY